MVDKIFYGIGLEEEEEQTSKGLSIEVANGGEIEGLAGRVGNRLERDGYTVSGVSTYTGEKQVYTRIIVKEDGMGTDLQDYFTDSKIEVDNTLLSAGTDIKIIIGTGQGDISE